MRRASWFLVAPMFALALLAPAPASATSPGRNGLMAYVDDAGLHTARRDTHGDRLLLPAAPEHALGNPSFSPDGQQIAYQDSSADQSKIFVVPVGGGTPRLLVDAVDGGYPVEPTWSPPDLAGGPRIAFQVNFPTPQLGKGGRSDIYSVTVEGFDLRRITHDRWKAWTCGPRSPSWSPDGAHLAFTRRTGPPGSNECNEAVLVLDLITGGQVRVGPAPRDRDITYLHQGQFTYNGRALLITGAGNCHNGFYRYDLATHVYVTKVESAEYCPPNSTVAIPEDGTPTPNGGLAFRIVYYDSEGGGPTGVCLRTTSGSVCRPEARAFSDIDVQPLPPRT